ncbi:MBL fold metallo-hydrolase [Novosphingobium lentum]|uniref:MBL fold metallo-hydrolase n=1 Tax=Novosphingobium lentum TaxID=145287 RepID=UPI00146FC9C0|nr:MBL fold metallo-hydrolase [Novosphingobium lentum]
MQLNADQPVRIMHRSSWALLILVSVLVPIYYWLLIDSSGGDAPHHLDIAALRVEANRMPGAKPVAIEYEWAAGRLSPGTLLVAGGGLKRQPVATIAFRLLTPGGDTMIDSGLSRQQAHAMGYTIINEARVAQIQQALSSARRLLFTHEHLDQIGGLLAHPEFGTIARHTILTPEQSPQAPLARNLPWPADKSALPAPLVYTGMKAVAPGIVLIRSPSHTPGSQMIFVQLQNGHEFVFPGDIAAMQRNVTWLRPRSRLLADWLAPEDRGQAIAWLHALAELKQQQPDLTIVYARDFTWLNGPRARALLHEGFTPDAAP